MNSIVCLNDGLQTYEGITIDAKNAYMAAKIAARFYRRVYPLFNKTARTERLKRAGGKDCHVYGLHGGFYLIVMPTDIIGKSGAAESDKIAAMHMAQSILIYGYKTLWARASLLRDMMRGFISAIYRAAASVPSIAQSAIAVYSPGKMKLK